MNKVFTVEREMIKKGGTWYIGMKKAGSKNMDVRINENIFLSLSLYIYMKLCWAFVVLVCVGASQRIPLSALARNPHKGPALEISHETGRTREWRS